jgi:hypothetical protein
MTSRKTFLMAAVVLSVPAMPALAHDDEGYGYDSHDRFHDQLTDAHERAHEYGFSSRAEHRAIIVPSGTFMTRPTGIPATIIRGPTITVTATAIVVGNERNVCEPRTREIPEMSRNITAKVALAVLAIGALAGSADAHPKLMSVSPAADVSSKVSPRRSS